jgi:hypothetical protein
MKQRRTLIALGGGILVGLLIGLPFVQPDAKPMEPIRCRTATLEGDDGAVDLMFGGDVKFLSFHPAAPGSKSGTVFFCQ